MSFTVDDLIKALEDAKASGIVTGDSAVVAGGTYGEVGGAWPEKSSPNSTGGEWPAVFMIE